MKVLTRLQKLHTNVNNLGKIIFATGFEICPIWLHWISVLRHAILPFIVRANLGLDLWCSAL